MLLATLLSLVALAAPVTEPATNVGATSATLNGTVDAPSVAHFEYGTSTNYGLATADEPVAAAGPVSAGITGLTVDTTYHYRIVSADGPGQDMTFTTGGPPGVSDQRSSGVTPTSATVSASIATKGLRTSYRIQWGTGTGYGRFSPTQSADTGTVAANVVLTGLLPNRTYHWRTRASNAAGTTLGPDKTFKTGPAPSGVSLSLSRGYVPWGGEVRLGGRVSGAGVNGLTVVLEQERFPLDSAFSAVTTARTGGDGGYLFTIPRLWTTTSYRVDHADRDAGHQPGGHRPERGQGRRQGPARDAQARRDRGHGAARRARHRGAPAAHRQALAPGGAGRRSRPRTRCARATGSGSGGRRSSTSASG